MSKTPIKPGTDNQKPGHYVEAGPRGGKVTNGHTATIGKGERLPPTSAKATAGRKSNLRLRTIVQWLYAFSINKSTFQKY